MNDIILNDAATLSSLEIAELTGERHCDVLIGIKKVLYRLELDSTRFLEEREDNNGVRLECFILPLREALITLGGYDIRKRAWIVDRLLEK